jgi:Ulp1 family protease
LNSFVKAAQNKPITLERKLALKTTGDKITPAQLLAMQNAQLLAMHGCPLTAYDVRSLSGTRWITGNIINSFMHALARQQIESVVVMTA